MSRTAIVFLMVSLLLPTLVVNGGCGASSPLRPSEGTTAAGAAQEHASDAVGEPSDQAQSAEIEKELASLSPQDRELAAKQRVCPVTGEQLGTMGTPVKVQVLGRDVFLCCDGCKDKLRAKPEEYLAKLPK